MKLDLPRIYCFTFLNYCQQETEDREGLEMRPEGFYAGTDKFCILLSNFTKCFSCEEQCTHGKERPCIAMSQFTGSQF